jgi:hypothetical protein
VKAVPNSVKLFALPRQVLKWIWLMTGFDPNATSPIYDSITSCAVDPPKGEVSPSALKIRRAGALSLPIYTGSSATYLRARYVGLLAH